jgi:hypothetical protein
VLPPDSAVGQPPALSPEEARIQGEILVAAAPTAVRVGVPLAVAPFTGGLSIPAAIALYGGASLAGDVAAQGIELATGQREEFSGAEAAINTAVGAVVPGLRAVPALKPLLAPGAKDLVNGSRAARIAANAVEGATLSAGQDTAIRAARGEEITGGTVGGSALYGAGLSTVLGTAFDEAARKVTLGRMFRVARGAGFQGNTVDDLRAWWQTPAAGRPQAPGAAIPAYARGERAPALPASLRPPPSDPRAFAAHAARASAANQAAPEPVGEIDYAAWETGGGMPAAGEREDWRTSFLRPSPEAQAILDGGAQPTTTLDMQAHPVVEFPVADIVVNKDVPQFKADGADDTGVVEALGGRYERLGTAPITLWQKLNGEVEVITGRHRLDLARRSGERTIPSQVVREQDGFTRAQALTFDAESNIRDGQGTVKDYAAYFRTRQDIGRADAETRGLLSRSRGAAGWHLGRDAGDDLFALYANNQIAEPKAVAIARGAPGHLAAQGSAIRAAARMGSGELELFARNLSRLAPDTGADTVRQLGFEGISSDFAAYEESAGKIAAAQNRRLRELGELVGAARGAAKNPAAAEKMGLPVKDPEALRARLAELEEQQARLRNPDADTWDELHTAAGLPVPPRKPDADLPPYALDSATPEQLAAEADRLRAQEAAAKQRDAIAHQAAAPLIGNSADVGQGALFEDYADLFSGPSAERAGGAEAAPENSVYADDGLPSARRMASGDGAAQQSSGSPQSGPIEAEVMRNSDGSPRVWYHGTTSKLPFTSFDRKKIGSGSIFTNEADAFFFSDAPPVAAMYAGLSGNRYSSTVPSSYESHPGHGWQSLEDSDAGVVFDDNAGVGMVGAFSIKPKATFKIQDPPSDFGEVNEFSKALRGLRNGTETVETISERFGFAASLPEFVATRGVPDSILVNSVSYDDGRFQNNQVLVLDERIVSLIPNPARTDQGAQSSLPSAKTADALPPFDPSAPILVRDGRRGAYWPVPLERLNDIPIVQMPEMVQLVKELTGAAPEVRRLPKALGIFRGEGAGTIELDHRIFRDPTVAAKVLAHEMGHLADYLPDRSLARGNLLGRIGSLLNYLKTSLPLDPKGGGQALEDADRRRLRIDAEKAIGKKPPADEPDERAAWSEAVAAKYAELVQDELESRGLIVEKGRERAGTSIIGASKSGVGIREELIGLSEYWKPIPEGAPEGYIRYRHSGHELYADALSVLLNSPGTLKRLAPTFYEAFFNHLDAKPEYKQALLDLYDFLSKPHLQVLQRRSGDIQAMFAKGDEILLRKAAEREARYSSMRGWWDRFRQELFDTFDPLVKKGEQLERAGKKIPDRYNPRFLFDEHPLGDNRNYEMVQRLWEKVVKPIEADGWTLGELGEYLFLQRVLNERLIRNDPPPTVVKDWKAAYVAAAKITNPALRAKATRELQEKLSEWNMSQNVGRTGVANPLGTTPETARLGLLRMRLEAGPERFARLEMAARVFHDTVFEQMQAAVDVGAYSREMFDATLAPNRDHYAAFGVLDYLEDYVPASIRMSQGTFKEIANPFTATLLKMVSVNRLIQVQKSKRGAVEFLQQFDPANIAPAATRFDGRRMVVEPPKDPDKGVLEYLEDGKPVGFYVDPAVAEMFEKLTPAHVSAVLRVLNWPFRNLIYPLIIKYNPAFQLVLGPARDLRRTLVNVPRGKGVRQVGELARNYLSFLGLPPTEAGEAVRAYLKGEPHELIAEMIATQAIGTPLDNFARDFGRADPMEKILADFGMAPDKARPGKLAAITKPVISALQAIEFAGLTNEMLPKVSIYKMLTRELGWSRKEAAYFVRNSVGVPNIHRKGRHTMVAEVIYPFTKVFLNGLRADARLARHPKTAGGWWARWAATDGIWTFLQALARLGILGVALKELYDGISDYNNTNYNTLPIGTTAGGEFGKRVVYMRLPRDETHRLVSGMLYQGMMLAGGEAGPQGTSSVLAFGADQVPGLNPLLEIGKAWKDYLEGDNPKDSFRGNPILSNAEWLAGGWPGTKSMLAFTADNMGVTNFVRYDPRANTTSEMVLSATPGLNRFIQSTATGYRERQEKMQKAESAERARLRLSMPDNVQRLAGEYYHLRSVPVALRTLEQTVRLQELTRWHKHTYQDYEDAIAVNPGDPMLKRQLAEQSAAYERRR